MRWSAVVVTGALVVGPSCYYSWGSAEQTTTRVIRKAEVRPRTDVLPGRGELLPDGTVRFTVELDRLCLHDRIADETRGITTYKQFNALSIATGLVSVATMAGGAYQLTTGDGDTAVIGIPPLVFGAAGMVITIVFRYVDPTAGSQPRKRFTKTEDAVVNLGTDEVRCVAAEPLGDLELMTPWGARATAKPSPVGIASFSIDWTDDRLDPSNPGVALRIAEPWEVRSPAMKLAARWTPSRADVARTLELAKQAANRIVTSGTPAQLTPNVDPSPLAIGGASRLVLAIENRGGSTAIDVAAKTRSSVAALHGLAFVFGKIHPGKTATRSLVVKLPDDTTGDTATVLFTFSEAAGNAPPELVRKLPLTRSLCPGGKLTRAQYDDKRKKLQRTVDAGDMSQDQFDRLDAEMLRCLE
jgi:hypothetical protein